MLTLYRAWREDRVLAALTALLALASLWPLSRCAIPPFIDLPHHAALGGLLWDVVFHRHGAERYFWVDPTPVPYWTVYALLAVFERIFGVFLGTRIVVGLALLSVPLGAMRLSISLGRSPRQALLAFLLAWDFNLYFGWLNHVLALGLGLFFLASFLEIERRADALRAAPLGLLLALTHVLPLVLVFLAAALATLLRPRALFPRVLALAAPAAILTPWLARSFAGSRVDPGAVFDPLAVRAQSLFAFTLGQGPLGPAAERAMGVAFLLLLVGPLVLACLPRVGRTEDRSVLALPGAALLLYLVLPLAVARPVTHWGTYPRFATPLFLGLMLLPRPRLSGARWLWLLPSVLSCLWSCKVLGDQMSAFDAEAAPFFAAERLVPEGARLLPLCHENKFKSARLPMGESLYALITARVGGYDPYLFDAPTTVVHYRPEAKLRSPPAFGRNHRLFTIDAYGDLYDYILVQGLDGDPVEQNPTSASKQTVKIFEGGRFRLYRVEPLAPSSEGEPKPPL